MLNLVEQNHLGHFKYLPEKLGFDILNEDKLTVINSKLNSSMFNIVYGVPNILKSDRF